MPESRKKEGFFGPYTEHHDDDGNKIGESREKEGFWGPYTEHTDAEGRKIGESRKREGFWGPYTEHSDNEGEKVGESRQKEGFFGPYTEHQNAKGEKIGESRQRQGFFGPYTEHRGQGLFGGDAEAVEAPPPSVASSEYDADSGSGETGCAGLIVGAVVIIFLAITLFATWFIWLVTIVLSALSALIYGNFKAKRIVSFESQSLRSVRENFANKGKKTFRDSLTSRDIRFYPDILLSLTPGLLYIIVIFAASDFGSTDTFSKILAVVAAGAGFISSFIISKRILNSRIRATTRHPQNK